MPRSTRRCRRRARQRGLSGHTFGSVAFDRNAAGLAAWLEAHRDPAATWQLVVPNSQVGAPLIARYGIPVMAVGGFLGRDDAISVARFADLISAGSVRVCARHAGHSPARRRRARVRPRH